MGLHFPKDDQQFGDLSGLTAPASMAKGVVAILNLMWQLQLFQDKGTLQTVTHTLDTIAIHSTSGVSNQIALWTILWHIGMFFCLCGGGVGVAYIWTTGRQFDRSGLHGTALEDYLKASVGPERSSTCIEGGMPICFMSCNGCQIASGCN